jgi:hypothetical protein
VNRFDLEPSLLAHNQPIVDTPRYDLSLQIYLDDHTGSERLAVRPNGGPFVVGQVYDTLLTPDRNGCIAVVEETLKVWQDLVIAGPSSNGEGEDESPFRRLWNLKKERDVLDRIAPRLAEAGAKLRFALFEKGGAEVQRFSAMLASAMAKPKKVRVISDSCFVPWGLLYDGDPDLPPDSSEFWDGFWGVRHVIDHETTATGSLIALPGAKRIMTSVGVDANLAQVDGPHVEFFRRDGRLDVDLWPSRDDVESTFKASPFTREIVYFYCHGDDDPPGLRLTDGSVIHASDFEYWRKNKPLESSPIVFVNACHGGVAHTRFYDSVAVPLLASGAAGLLGAHTEVPEVFAMEFAERFFKQFLKQGSRTVRVGPLMRTLTKQFLSYANPLGLVYTLYRASDVYVDWQRSPAKVTVNGG